jgi:hypothetical protein
MHKALCIPEGFACILYDGYPFIASLNLDASEFRRGLTVQSLVRSCVVVKDLDA